MADEGAGDGQQGGDLAERERDRAHDEPDDGVAQERAQGAARLDGAAQAEEEARADGAGDADHGEVALGEAAGQRARLGRRDQVAVVPVVRTRRRVRLADAALDVGVLAHDIFGLASA